MAIAIFQLFFCASAIAAAAAFFALSVLTDRPYGTCGGGAKGGCAVEGVIPHYGVDIGACGIHEIAAGTTVNMHIDEAGTDIESGGINDFRLLGEF